MMFLFSEFIQRERQTVRCCQKYHMHILFCFSRIILHPDPRRASLRTDCRLYDKHFEASLINEAVMMFTGELDMQRTGRYVRITFTDEQVYSGLPAYIKAVFKRLNTPAVQQYSWPIYTFTAVILKH